MHDPSTLVLDIRGIPLSRRAWRRWLRDKRVWSLPTLFEVWHDEPGGADAGKVCKGPRTWLHWSHCRIKFIPWRDFKHRFVRCSVCNRRMNTAARFGTWNSTEVAHSECIGYARFLQGRPLHAEVLHRLLTACDVHTKDQLRELIVDPDEHRDQFLLWYDTWGIVEQYRDGRIDRWVAPNEHLHTCQEDARA